MQGDAPQPLPSEVQELIRQLRKASARAIKIIRNPPGKSERSKSFNQTHAAAQLAQFDRELKALEHRAVNIASKTVRKAFDQGIKDAEKMARDIGVSDGAIKGSFSQVETRRAQVLIRDTANDIGHAVRSIGQNTRKIVRKTHAEGLDDNEVNRLMAGETLAGRAPKALRELRKLIKDAAIDGKIVTVNPRTGEIRHFKPDFYADLVFQTKLAEATNIATLERLRAKKINYVRIIGSNSTNFCTAFVNKVYFIGEGKDPLGLYPHITELPRGGAPFHPRCTKRYVAFVPGLASEAEKEAGKPSPETIELHGKNPAEAQRKFEQDDAPKGPKPSPPSAATPTPGPPISQPPLAAPAPTASALKKPVDLIKPPKSGDISKQAKEALEIISKVHRVPATSVEIPLRVVSRSRYDGACNISRETRLPTEIIVRASAAHPPTTVAHEFGHYVDSQVFSRKNSPFPLNGFEQPELSDWSDAVLRSRPFGIYAINEEFPGTHPELRKYLRYLMEPWECFARSYAQWIAHKSGDRGMLERMAQEANLPIPRQWTEEEFEPIGNALDAAFRKAGLLE